MPISRPPQRFARLSQALIATWLAFSFALLPSAASAQAPPPSFDLADMRAPTRAPVLVYERVGNTLAGPPETLITVYSDGTVWLFESVPMPVHPPSCFDDDGDFDRDFCHVVPTTDPALETVPVGFVPVPNLIRFDRLNVPPELVDSLIRDLHRLGATRIRGGQNPALVPDTPLTTITYFRPRPRDLRDTAPLPARPVTRANSFSYFIAEGPMLEIEDRIEAFIQWIHLFELRS